jgi:hypothetical protein
MNPRLAIAAFATGLAVLAWIAAGYVATSPLALAMTLLIGAVYLAGGLELRRHHQATCGLQQALLALPAAAPDTPAALDGWLQQLHPSLQHPVRLRIDGERVGLPGPALAPYLVGLLVLLGMLGTFLGMVLTLRGAAAALQTSADLPTIRAALTAPVQGLGLAFGTSVAGVAASAMLGLVSALCRRARLQAGQLLDSRIASHLQQFSQAHQRAQMLLTLQALQQQQALAMPALVDQLQAVTGQLAQQGQALGAQLLANQEGFHRSAQAGYSGLAAAVEQSLRHSLAESARLASATIAPVVDATLAGLGRETASLHAHIATAVQQQLDGLAARFGSSADSMAATWQAALVQQQQSDQALRAELQAAQAGWAQTLAQQSAALLAAADRTQRQLLDDLATRDAQRLDALVQPLQAMAAQLHSDWQLAGTQGQQRQQAVADALAASVQAMHAQADLQTRATAAEVSRLLQAAGEAPRAAAEAMAALRQQLQDSLARDSALQAERSHTAATLGRLLDAVQHTATAQRDAIDQLVAASSAQLQQAAERLDSHSAAESGKLTDAATQVAASALEVASLGEAFGAAVGQFGAGNQALVGQLARTEAALAKSLQRSDEQLAYYVAQAREIIDLSLLSQQQILDRLQQLASRAADAAPEPA